MKFTVTLALSYVLRATLVVSAALLVMFDSWLIALCILPVLALDYLIHKSSTKKVMMGLFVMLVVVQTLVLGILSVKFMMFEDEMSFFKQSLHGPDTGFVDQVRASYSDMRAGNVVSGVKSLQYSASKAIVDQTKGVRLKVETTLDKTLSKYLHVTDLISLFGDMGDGSRLTTDMSDGGQSNMDSASVIRSAFGVLPSTNFPDLRNRSTTEVRMRLAGIFGALPAAGFSGKYLNPCWEAEVKPDFHKEIKKISYSKAAGEGKETLHCLPAAYLLGQPKSGTTDLYARLGRHHDIHHPQKKEIRWFTRGEFSDQPYKPNDLIDERTSVFDYTHSFTKALPHIKRNPDRAITLDGGPHTFWWPLQAPDGSPPPEGLIPPAQIIRELTPNAKFLITLSNPVSRMYSDYHFLNDDRRVANGPNRGRKADVDEVTVSEKSPEIFHQRVVKQVSEFRKCVSDHMNSSVYLESLSALPADTAAGVASFLAETFHDETLRTQHMSADVRQAVVGRWFRSAQICAHDRHAFGVAGWGRLSIGLYSLYYEKWLEHFHPSQFKVVRLEDYDASPREYLKDIYAFLGVDMPVDNTEWTAIIGPSVKNQHHDDRLPMLLETQVLLEKFYRPYNILLAKALRDRRFTWSEFLTANTHSHNAHGPASLGHDGHDVNDDHSSSKVSQKDFQLRYGGLSPQSFSLEWLTQPSEPHAVTVGHGNQSTEFNAFVGQIVKRATPPSATKFKDKTGDEAVCAAAFGLDLAALKYLLWEVGVTVKASKGITPFHCLSSIYIMSEASSKSLLFSMLKGVDSWMSPIIGSTMPKHASSIRAMDIVETLGPLTVQVAEWLLAAGHSVNSATSTDGVTPLHLAAEGGMTPLVKFLLEHGAEPNVFNNLKTSPLMYALSHGHSETAAVLIAHGADMDHKDIRGISGRDIIEVRGPVSVGDALKYFNVTQAPLRTIERPLHPVYPTSAPTASKDNGGWATTRLKGFEEDMHCDIDQYEFDEISGVDLFEKYIARQRPVLLRAGAALSASWPALEIYSRAALIKNFGEEVVTASSIPYADKFGGSPAEKLTIAEYINEMTLHNISGGEYPWYVFKGNPIRKVNDLNDHSSVVDFDLMPTPPSIEEVFHHIGEGRNYNSDEAHQLPQPFKVLKERKNFINAQWALGGAGSGAPIHFHNTAWNALVYGAKKWYLYPPHDMIMSNAQIKEFIEVEMPLFENRSDFKPVKAVTCVQTSGDIMIVPESWGHGVLNIQDSVAVATESTYGMWRIKTALPFSKILTNLSPNSRSKKSKTAEK